MREFLITSLTIIVILTLCACGFNSNGSGFGQTPGPNNISHTEGMPPDSMDGDETMDERLVTKEELFEYIQTHDVGLAIEDFDGIDVDDFITTMHFTPSNIEMLWVRSLEMYKNRKKIDERIDYFAKEKVYMESTDEEYEVFVNVFFQAINMGVSHSYYDDLSGFYCYMSDSRDYLYIAKTKDFNKLTITNDPNRHPELLVAYIPHGDAELSGNLCYSKNKKFILLATPYDDLLFEYVKIFCTIDD